MQKIKELCRIDDPIPIAFTVEVVAQSNCEARCDPASPSTIDPRSSIANQRYAFSNVQNPSVDSTDGRCQLCEGVESTFGGITCCFAVNMDDLDLIQLSKARETVFEWWRENYRFRCAYWQSYGEGSVWYVLCSFSRGLCFFILYIEVRT